MLIDKDELISIAVNLDSIMYLMSDISENYFAKYDSHSKDDSICILFGFNRYRTLTQAVYELLFSIQKEFEKYGITPYWN